VLLHAQRQRRVGAARGRPARSSSAPPSSKSRDDRHLFTFFLSPPRFSPSMSEIRRARPWRSVERRWHCRESPRRRVRSPQGRAHRHRAVSPRRPEPLPERLWVDGERRLLSVTRTAADPVPLNGGGVNGKVGPIGRSFLPFALCFSDLGLGFDDSVFVNSKSISCYFISQTRSTT
jgi:hypothetical protein